MYRNLGLDLAGCAQLLHVTERTLHNWQSGKHDIPYAAYRLLRLLNRMELPGDSWAGWCFHGGKLWTPEGRSFVGTDGSWWSLLVRRAAMFDKLHRLRHWGPDAERRDACRDAGAARAAAVSEASCLPALAGGRREAPALDLSMAHISTARANPALFYGSVAIKFESANVPQWHRAVGGKS
ncbi:VC1465 family Xer recombination activation factor [Paracidovorax anthurii]|uniref:Uncharacterized protein DUF3653 n=1 Tax=Paracidovorax anthurii TaxID=78229 RepID=A0A328YUM8_9BURK|nr:VC1465 family Xer recombination activation factor [Paracidovorax anthurii]RAR75892.1 uncharacterized protein DUF3653 [Paracidovorax anthurii]